jgi:chromosomal replication initiation ATPase DnaA
MTDAQLPLPLPTRTAMGREDFLEASCNAMALAFLDIWPNWPNNRLAIVGPESAGKSHLAAVWAAASGARIIQCTELSEAAVPDLVKDHVVVEDVHQAMSPEQQRALFHLHNLLAADGKSLLITGRGAPSSWPIQLADLNSRLQAMTLAQLRAPDDQILAGLLVKHFADRQIVVPPSVVAYVIPRIERSFAGVQRIAAKLDRAALASQKPITRTLARAVLDSEAPEA